MSSPIHGEQGNNVIVSSSSGITVWTTTRSQFRYFSPLKPVSYIFVDDEDDEDAVLDSVFVKKVRVSRNSRNMKHET